MARATPEHMRQFLSRMYAQLSARPAGVRAFAIPHEDADNYEQVITEFFSRVLDLPPERAVVLLWLFASEMFYSRLGEQYTQELSELCTFDIPSDEPSTG